MVLVHLTSKHINLLTRELLWDAEWMFLPSFLRIFILFWDCFKFYLLNLSGNKNKLLVHATKLFILLHLSELVMIQSKRWLCGSFSCGFGLESTNSMHIEFFFNYITLERSGGSSYREKKNNAKFLSCDPYPIPNRVIISVLLVTARDGWYCFRSTTDLESCDTG